MTFQRHWNKLLRNSAYFATFVKLLFAKTKIIGVRLANKMDNIFALNSSIEENNFFFNLIGTIPINESVSQIGLLNVFGDGQILVPKLFFTLSFFLDVCQ